MPLLDDPKKKKPNYSGLNIPTPTMAGAPQTFHSPAQPNAAAFAPKQSAPDRAISEEMPSLPALGRGSIPQQIGASARFGVDVIGGGLNLIDRSAQAIMDAQRGAYRDFGASFMAGRPTAAPIATAAVATPPAPVLPAAPAKKPEKKPAAGVGGAGSPAPQVAAAPRPDFSQVRGSVQGPFNVPAPAPAAPPPLNSGYGQHGEPIYDNASVQRLMERMALPGAAGVTNQSFGGAAAVARPSVPMLNADALPMDVPMMRPRVADSFAARQASEQRAALLSNIDSALFQARGGGSRSSNALIGSLYNTAAGLVNEGGQQAIDLAQGNRNAATATDHDYMDQFGQSQRIGMQEAGATQRQDLINAGAYDRALLDLVPRPTQATLADGTLAQITGTNAAPVVGPDGLPVRPRDTSNVLSADKQAELLKAQFDAVSKNLYLSDEDRAAQLDALSQQMAQLRSGNQQSAGAPSGVGATAVNPQTGQRIRKNAKGEWEPIK